MYLHSVIGLSYSPQQQEIDELCDEWQPEPLHTTLPESKLPLKDIVITRYLFNPMMMTPQEGFALYLVAGNPMTAKSYNC